MYIYLLTYFGSVCLSVCLFVSSMHNSKTNDPKVFKLVGIGNDLGYPTNDVVLGLKGRSRFRLITIMPMLMHI